MKIYCRDEVQPIQGWNVAKTVTGAVKILQDIQDSKNGPHE